MRCGGARETREPRVTIEWLLPKENISSNIPAFQDPNGVLKIHKIQNNKNQKFYTALFCTSFDYYQNQ